MLEEHDSYIGVVAEDDDDEPQPTGASSAAGASVGVNAASPVPVAASAAAAAASPPTGRHVDDDLAQLPMLDEFHLLDALERRYNRK
jgi:myosin heavy subunit